MKTMLLNGVLLLVTAFGGVALASSPNAGTADCCNGSPCCVGCPGGCNACCGGNCGTECCGDCEACCR